MNNSSFRFSFKPAVASQRTLLRGWLAQDYIHEWIHGQGLQNTLASMEKFFECRPQSKALTRTSDLTQHWIGYDDNKPFVYLLVTNVFKTPEDGYAKYSEIEGLAITLDIFICDPEYLGKGLASTVVSEFLRSKFADVSEVFIDPEVSNKRAVHVYQKIGFCIMGEFVAHWYPVNHYVMKLNMEDLFIPQ